MKLKTEDPLNVQQRRRGFRLLLVVAVIAVIALLITVPISQYQDAQRMNAKATLGASLLETLEAPVLTATP